MLQKPRNCVSIYEKATKHLENSLATTKEIGDKKGEASCYTNLGVVYQSVGDYANAKEHQEKALAVKKEIGDRKENLTVTRTMEYYINQLANMRRLENTSKNHLR